MTDQVDLPALRAQLFKWKQLKERWEEIERFCQGQIDHRFNEMIRHPDIKTDNLHYMRGECAGIDLFRRMPDIEIDRLEHEVKIRQQREGEVNEDSNATVSAP